MFLPDLVPPWRSGKNRLFRRDLERDFAQRRHDEADEYSGQHARNSGRAGWRSQGRSVHPSSYVRTGWSLPRISWDGDRPRSSSSWRPAFSTFPNYLFRITIIFDYFNRRKTFKTLHISPNNNNNNKIILSKGTSFLPAGLLFFSSSFLYLFCCRIT